METEEEMIHKKLVVPGVLSSLETVHRWAVAALGELRLPEAALHNILLAISEAVTNAIRHGSNELAGHSVSVSLDANSRNVAIQVDDEGPGFDPAAVPDPTQGERVFRPGGRGIFLLRALTNDLQVRSSSEGTQVLFNIVLK
jgi:serine/threonine-protein kinase RsbW